MAVDIYDKQGSRIAVNGEIESKLMSSKDQDHDGNEIKVKLGLELESQFTDSASGFAKFEHETELHGGEGDKSNESKNNLAFAGLKYDTHHIDYGRNYGVIYDVDGAQANELPDQVPEEVKEARYHRFMQVQQQISKQRLQEKIGSKIWIMIDELDEQGAVGRSMADAPEIDGVVYLNDEFDVNPGDIFQVLVEHADEYDLWATRHIH
nr:porin [Candidatus Arsenophonus nilaparvatae]